MRPSRYTALSVAALLLPALALATSGQAFAAAPARDAGKAAVAQAISDCRKITDKDARLDCYDKAADAFDQAEAQGQVVVIDRAQAHQIKRQAFGFNMPSLTLFKQGPKEDKLDRIQVKLASAHRDIEGKWVMTTDDGAVWRQTDDNEPFDPPRAGDAMTVRTGMLGSYFCKVGANTSMRCARSQ